MQVATTAIIQQQQQNQQPYNTHSPAERTNDNMSTVLQQNNNKTQWSEMNEDEAEYEIKIKIQKPEVMCNKTEIIKSEQQYSKTNEKENDKEEKNDNQNKDENENENGKAPTNTEEGERVLLERSMSYTISCHIAEHEEATAIEMDKLQEKIIKNQQQLTITSADDNSGSSTNGIKVRQQQRQPTIAEPASATTNRVWHAEMQHSSSIGHKTYDGAAEEGRGEYSDDNGEASIVSKEEEEHAGGEDGENAENSESDYTNDSAGYAHEIDVSNAATDATANDVHQSNVAQLWRHINAIQSLVAQPAAEMQATEQLTSSLETDNDKTYEYDAQQPLEDDLSVRNATQAAAERMTVSNGNNENNIQMYSPDEAVDRDVDDNDDGKVIYDVSVDDNEDRQVDYDKN